MTRARERLYLLNVVVRRIWGNISYQEPARFFAEMPLDLIEFKDYASVASRSGAYRGEISVTTTTVMTTNTSNVPDVVGLRLDHPEYGDGKIVATEGAGTDQKVTVEFRGRDRRKFLLRFLKAFIEES
jgi:DNA helicase-2/ATP-dependent DNA helicase PcrA